MELKKLLQNFGYFDYPELHIVQGRQNKLFSIADFQSNELVVPQISPLVTNELLDTFFGEIAVVNIIINLCF